MNSISIKNQSPASRKVRGDLKLLRDFPWLWAIKQEWCPGSENIIVRNQSDPDLSVALQTTLDLRVWVVCQDDQKTKVIGAPSFGTSITVAATVAARLRAVLSGVPRNLYPTYLVLYDRRYVGGFKNADDLVIVRGSKDHTSGLRKLIEKSWE